MLEVLSFGVPTDAEKLKDLIERELRGVRDERVVGLIRGLLVEPKLVLRGWDYGQPNEQYPCWDVLDDSAGSDTGIAFCEHGFGPRCPWGLVGMSETEGQPSSIGMDSGWFPTFMEAFFDSFAAAALPIWRVFSMDSGAPGKALTDELSWADAWKRCEDARNSAPGSHFMVRDTITSRA